MLWGMLSIVSQPFANSSTATDIGQLRGLFTIVTCFRCWSSLAPWFVRAPIRWIFNEFNLNTKDSTRDPHLRNFERLVIVLCLIATPIGIIAQGLGLVSFWYQLWQGERIAGLVGIGVGLLGIVLNFLALQRHKGNLQTPSFRWI